MSSIMQGTTTEAVVAIKNWLGDPTSMIDEPMAQALRDLADTIVLTLGAAGRTPLVDPSIQGGVGPNGGRVEFAGNGDLMELFPDIEIPDGEEPTVVRRNLRSISEAYEAAREKVWWNRMRRGLESIKALRGEREPEDEVTRMLWKMADAIERKYGRKALGSTAYDFGLLTGAMSALAWVQGAEWEDSEDSTTWSRFGTRDQ